MAEEINSFVPHLRSTLSVSMKPDDAWKIMEIINLALKVGIDVDFLGDEEIGDELTKYNVSFYGSGYIVSAFLLEMDLKYGILNVQGHRNVEESMK